MSNNNWDPFGDVSAETLGVFGPEQAALQPGLKKLRTVHAMVKPQGVLMQFDCQVCGIPTVMEIEYPELVALKYGVNPLVAFRHHPNILQNPTRWEFSPADNGWKPDIRCGQCHANASKDLCIEPHEPEKMLVAARRRDYINPIGEQEVSAICAKISQAGKNVRR